MNKTFNKPYSVYANKLIRFLNDGTYDNDTLCLLGAISAKVRRKHMKLDDGIKTAITNLMLENIEGNLLIAHARLI